MLTGCGNVAETFSGSEHTAEADASTSEDDTGLVITTEEYEPEEYELTLSAVGDNLIHTPIFKKAAKGDGTYDFTPMYEHVKDYIASYDISVVNQETIFVEDDSNVSSYPCFGTPEDMGEALIDTGFDVVLSATNHTWDKGITGVTDTLNYWAKYPEITLLGIHDSEEDYEQIDYMTKNNIDLALFNYTYGLNGFTLPSDKKYLVNLLDDKEKFLNDVKSVEDQVDFTVCFLHIGTEYTYTPTDFQKDYIADLIDAGADLVICAHPHVVEPYEMVTTDSGNSALVYYSCGNFISAQDAPDRMLGGMASVTLKKTVDGDTETNEIASYDFIPLVTHFNSSVHTVYRLEDYTDELASQHSMKAKYPDFSVSYLWDLWDEIMQK
jgi:poly-gamma-glutamate synthesis protein (capsule biosynthesis protein)